MNGTSRGEPIGSGLVLDPFWRKFTRMNFAEMHPARFIKPFGRPGFILTMALVITSEQVLESIVGTLLRINPREEDIPSSQIGRMFGALEGIRRICDCAQNLVIESR
jgi:hypothetical protein